MTVLNSSSRASAPLRIGNLAMPLAGMQGAVGAAQTVLDILKLPACAIDNAGTLAGMNAQWVYWVGAAHTIHSIPLMRAFILTINATCRRQSNL
jgi:hypothetical protein